MIAQSPANVDCIAFVEMSRYDEAMSVLGVVQALTEDQLKAMTDSDLDNRLKAALESDANKEMRGPRCSRRNCNGVHYFWYSTGVICPMSTCSSRARQ